MVGKEGVKRSEKENENMSETNNSGATMTVTVIAKHLDHVLDHVE